MAVPEHVEIVVHLGLHFAAVLHEPLPIIAQKNLFPFVLIAKPASV